MSLKIEDVCKDLEQCGLYTFRPSGAFYWLYQSGLYTFRLSEALENHISAPEVRKVYRILKNVTNILQFVTLVKWHCEQWLYSCIRGKIGSSKKSFLLKFYTPESYSDRIIMDICLSSKFSIIRGFKYPPVNVNCYRLDEV